MPSIICKIFDFYPRVLSMSRGKQIGQLMMTTVGNELLLSLLLLVVGLAL